MIYPIRTIVAGIADLDAGDLVLGGAIELARQTGARLHLVHGFELPSLAWDAYGRMGYVDAQTLDEYAESLRELLRRAVAGFRPIEGIRYHMIAAPPATAVHDVGLAEGADLVAVGASRRGSVAKVLLGTTAQRVVRSATAPVLILRQVVPPQCQRVLLTTDLSPFSAGVHELGLDVLDSLCGVERPEIRSLLVVRSSMGLPAPFRLDQLESMAHRELETFVEQRRDRGRKMNGIVRFGEPAEEIAKEAAAWKPDLVLVGTHSRPSMERWLLGSVAEAAIRDCSANVLVIPAKAEEQRELPVRRTKGTEVVAAPHFN
ncbi:MAG: universal stress protein [Dehalococcoidia bacterium]